MEYLRRMLHWLKNQNENWRNVIEHNRQAGDPIQIVHIGISDLQQEFVFLLFAQRRQDADNPEVEVLDKVGVSYPSDKRSNTSFDLLVGRAVFTEKTLRCF